MCEASDLPESRLYTFVDGGVDFALYWLEGQRLIRDLALIHGVAGPGFAYFRDVVLGAQPLLAFLGRGEQFGLYLDSEEPYLRLKIETGHHGETRCAFVAGELPDAPRVIRGVVRLLRLSARNRPPYQSVIRIEGLSADEIANRVLAESYQVPARVVVSMTSDQSALLHRLPGSHAHGLGDDLARSVRDLEQRIAGDLARIFERALSDPDEVARAFAALGFRPLASRPVRFACGCSRERMMRNLALVIHGGTPAADLFEPHRDSLRIVCEYCKTIYGVSRAELSNAASPIH